jgi:hypothetical protein
MPAADAAASIWMNSRFERLMRGQTFVGPPIGAGSTPVDRRFRVEQQGHQVLELGFVEQLRVPEARHARAGVVGLGVVELAPGVLDDRLRVGARRIGHAAQLAVVVEARAECAEGDLGLVDHVAVVAIAAVDGGGGGGVGPRHAAAVLGELLAFFPVADETTVGRHLHGLQVGRLDAPGRVVGQGLAFGFRALDVRGVLLQAIDLRDALVAERGLHHPGDERVVVGCRRRHRGATREHRREDGGSRSGLKCLEEGHGLCLALSV